MTVYGFLNKNLDKKQRLSFKTQSSPLQKEALSWHHQCQKLGTEYKNVVQTGFATH